jgi:hypothetical protein
MHRQQDDLISLLLLFQNKESRLKIRWGGVLDLSGSGYGPCEHVNEAAGFIKTCEHLDYLSDC